MGAMPEEVREIYDSATVEHYELAVEYQASSVITCSMDGQ